MGLIADIAGKNVENQFNQVTPDLNNPLGSLQASEIAIPDFQTTEISQTVGDKIGQFNDATGSAINELSNTGEQVGEDFDKFASGIQNTDFEGFEDIANNTKETIGGIGDFVNTTADDTGNKLDDTFNDFAGGIGDLGNNAVTTTEQTTSGLMDVLDQFTIPQVGNIIPEGSVLKGDMLPDVGNVELPFQNTENSSEVGLKSMIVPVGLGIAVLYAVSKVVDY